MNVPRIKLNVLASPKGLIAGRIRFKNKEGKWIDCNSLSKSGGCLISHELTELDFDCSQAKYILVIEKEGIFNQLCQQKFHLMIPCVLITGKGFADYSTRILLSKLCKLTTLPLLGICDFNPSGASIIFNYKYGSIRSSKETSEYCASRLKWLSILCDDFSSGILSQIPEHQKQPFDSEDYKLVQQLASMPYAKEFPEVMNQLAKMKSLAFKMELQALYWKGEEFLSQFLSSKILRKQWVL